MLRVSKIRGSLFGHHMYGYVWVYAGPLFLEAYTLVFLKDTFHLLVHLVLEYTLHPFTFPYT